MKITFFFLGAIFVALMLTNCNGESAKVNKPTTASSISEVLSPTDFKAKLENSSLAQLVDVRTAEEYQAGSLQDAKNIDFFGEQFKSEMDQLNKEQPLFLFCKKGGRSAKAADICQELGFKEIYDMTGGYTAWKAEGN